MKFLSTYSTLLLYSILFGYNSQAQSGSSSLDASSSTGKILNFPSRFFNKIQGKTASLDQELSKQTQKYLQNMERHEAKLRKKLEKVDPTAAQRLFGASVEQYTVLEERIRNDTGGHKAVTLRGEYQPYTDSLKGALSFFQQNPQQLGSQSPALQSSIAQLQQLQAKMQDADEVKAYIQQRKQQISSYISQHANMQNLLGAQYQAMTQDVYYYSQQLRQYKEMLNQPDQLEQKMLSLLDQLPAWKIFMNNNSQLAGLFSLPAHYGSSASLVGLQTRDQVSELIQGQLASGGPGASAALESNLQSAKQQLDQYKDKLRKLGGGSGDIEMPDFKPNEQKTKTFWKRLQYGTNLQTTKTNYYFPTMTDVGFSIGYKLTNTSTVGIGASYKIGWGAGINHIALSRQGAGLRSFLEIKIKGTFSATGGMEYNYTTPINSLQQLKVLSNWTQSGLIGLSKTVSVKNRFFKQTKLQLLWDFLSYQQIPKTEPIIFRVGYNF